MADAIALSLALVALASTLIIAVVRPRRVSEAGVAVLGALILISVGAISLTRAEAALRELGGTIAFLAALLLIAEGCRREGLFAALGGLMATRAGGDRRRLLPLVFAVASTVTIVLGLGDGRPAAADRARHRPARAQRSSRPALCVRTPGQLSLAAAARIEPHQPARVSRQRIAFTHFGQLMALSTVRGGSRGLDGAIALAAGDER